MNADALYRAIIEHGGDENGIRDRFGDNLELYDRCVQDFLSSPNIPELGVAMDEKDYDRAFDTAHSLKGLSGNLGLSAYYAAICALVESLRAKNYENVDAEYAAVRREFENIRALCAGGKPKLWAPFAFDSDPDEGLSPAELEEKDEDRKNARFIHIIAGVAVATVLAVLLLFNSIVANYERNVTVESAGHLTELNYQLKKYVEDQVESDWLTAYTVRSYISHSGGTDEDILQVIEELRELWRASDIILYTEDGFSVSASGRTEANDVASELLTEAFLRGESLRIVESDITYTVPAEAGLTYKGSRISAVSVVKSMASFLDEMGFSAFDESAQVFLCNENGSVVSRLSTENAIVTFNVLSLVKEGTLTNTNGSTAEADALTACVAPTAYLLGDDYFVFTPVETRSETFYLAYFVPENIVNKTMSRFSESVTVSSLIVISIFTVLAGLAVIYINNLRRNQMNKALLTREHMFDLLVKSSQTGFALLEIDEPEPSFVSSNLTTLTGVQCPTLHKTERGLELHGGAASDASVFERVNETLRSWDGAGTFRTGFILNEKAAGASYYEVQLMPAGEGSGEYIAVAQDVTLLHERDAATREALKMAEHASEAKSRFLSNMSHDIRTPMNAIVNMTDFAIEDMADPDKLREHLKTIRESSDHLLLLINDILDMSRIESGNAFVDAAPFDLSVELDRLKSITGSLCAAKNQLLITDFSSIRTPVVLGDRMKVSQILMNLLSNAVKFTPRNGGVRFTAEELPSMMEDKVHLRFTVEDNGIGIAQEFLPHVFSPFSRQDDSRVKRIQGTGLGLSICHSYVLAMGGDIRCSSEEGEGTIFTVELYLGKTEAAPEVMEDASAMDVAPFIGLRCLLCEDNETNQRIARTLLERLGFRVDIAFDGSDGVKTFRQSPERYYDVVYMDIQMPVMDGYEAAVAIRKSGRPDSESVPIIAMSANVFIEDIEKAHIAGMDGYVGKPVSTVAVANETKKVLNNRRPTL